MLSLPLPLTLNGGVRGDLLASEVAKNGEGEGGRLGLLPSMLLPRVRVVCTGEMRGPPFLLGFLLMAYVKLSGVGARRVVKLPVVGVEIDDKEELDKLLECTCSIRGRVSKPEVSGLASFKAAINTIPPGYIRSNDKSRERGAQLSNAWYIS